VQVKDNKEVNLMANRNQLVVPGAEAVLNSFKTEIASEFGVKLSGETPSRANGSVGGEITKRLVSMAQQQLGGKS
jgi:small acid-soluble spore protein B (major beta-type SASP)